MIIVCFAARGVVHVAGLHHEEAHSVGEVLQLLRRCEDMLMWLSRQKLTILVLYVF